MKNNLSHSLPIDNIRAAMFGHAVADAMGVPVEFMDRNKLKFDPVTDYRGYGSHHVPVGTWSDDTSMAIATLDSLAHGLDYSDMMQRFCAWKHEAKYTATDEVFDMGITTNHALSSFSKGTPALKCGCCDEYDNGNGSLMRIIPAALYCKYKIPFASLEEHLDVIHNTSRLTHSHPRSLVGCGIYALILMELLTWRNKYSIRLGLKKAKAYYRTLPEYQNEMAHYSRVFRMYYVQPGEDEIKSGGYVVSTLEAALWCILTTESYSECILKAVNLGSDTDTVAAVAGGLAGVLYGVEGIPEKWYQGLIRHEVIDDLCKIFMEGAAEVSFSAEPAKPIEQAPGHRMIDIHSHMLFDIDDGTRGIEMSLEMLRSAYKQGVTDVFCTSHSHGALDKYQKNFRLLQERVAMEIIPITLHSGCEIYCSYGYLKNIVSCVLKGTYPTLADSPYILLEFDPYEDSEHIEACVRFIQAQAPDHRIVIAHIERCKSLRAEWDVIETLLSLDCCFQINAYSLQEETNESTKSFARELLEKGYVTFIGSDAHRPNHRPPAVEKGIEYIYSHCEQEYADAVCYKNAEALLLCHK